MDNRIHLYENSDIAVERFEDGFRVDSPMGTYEASTEEEVAAVILGLAGVEELRTRRPQEVYLTTVRKDSILDRRAVLGFRDLNPDRFLEPPDLSQPKIQKAHDWAQRAREGFAARQATVGAA